MPILALRTCLALLSVFLFAGNAAADTPAAANYAGGNGSEGNPFQISTLAELRLFMNSSGAFPNQAYYKLTATIDAADTSTWMVDGLPGWRPVDATLMDAFDGQNFEIQNLFINRPLQDGVGFFKGTANICCQELKNIRIVGGQITGHDQVGGLIGSPGQFVLAITNSHSTATITGNASVGGLVGYAQNGTITGSSSGGTVNGTGDFVGGLVGTAAGTAIASSHATGHVTGKRQVGGLVGIYFQNSAAPLTTSWATGQVDGDDRVGGLIGDSQGKVTFSHATGAVTATGVNPTIPGYAMAGGLLGSLDMGRALEDSYASGAVLGPLNGIGGLVGFNRGSILRCSTTATQTVTGSTGSGSIGGLVGENQGSITSSRAAGTVNASGAAIAVGGLVGHHVATGFNIATSYATGNVTATGASKVGGLVGWQSIGQITGSHATGNVSGLQQVGGLVGESSPNITNSYATGTVSGLTFVGGLVGNKTGGQVDTCFATGAVTGSGDYTGGLLGFSTAVVLKSYAKTGAVTGARWTGGLVGLNQRSIDRSYAINNVNGTQYVGGLVGDSNDGASFGLKDCYAKGAVGGTDSVGGLVGTNASLSNIAHCYASGSVGFNVARLSGDGATASIPANFGGLIGNNSRQNNYENYFNADTAGHPGVGAGFTAGATGLSTVQMKQQAMFTGFDFSSIWQINEGVTEPFLNGAVAVTTTSTGLASSGNPSVTGQSVTFTATVTGNGPTGTMLFQEGGNPVNGCIAVIVSANQAQCTVTGFALGSHGISALYSGDSLNTGSLSPTLNQVVVTVPVTTTTTSLASSGNPSLFGQNVVFTATVAGNGPTGTMLFQEGGIPVSGCIAVTVTANQAQCTVTGFALGSHSMSALYSGDSLNTGSLSPTLNQMVVTPSLDVDASITGTKFDALTDGLLIVRYMEGLTGSALVAGTLGPTAARNDPVAMKGYLDAMAPLLDIDDNGTADPLTDGVLIVRYMLGLRGDALIADAVDLVLGNRKLASEIETWIQTLMP